MEKINHIKTEPLALKALVRLHDVRLWQIVRRCLSNGCFTRESEVSRILNGIVESRPELKVQLDQIETELREYPTTNEKVQKRLEQIKEEIAVLERKLSERQPNET